MTFLEERFDVYFQPFRLQVAMQRARNAESALQQAVADLDTIR